LSHSIVGSKVGFKNTRKRLGKRGKLSLKILKTAINCLLKNCQTPCNRQRLQNYEKNYYNEIYNASSTFLPTKINPCFMWSHSLCFGIEGIKRQEPNSVIFKGKFINNRINQKVSSELFIDTVIKMFILKNNQTLIFPCFTHLKQVYGFS